MGEQGLVETKGVSLYPTDWAMLDAFAKDAGLGRSAALRMILREWKDLKRRGMSLPLSGVLSGRDVECETVEASA